MVFQEENNMETAAGPFEDPGDDKLVLRVW